MDDLIKIQSEIKDLRNEVKELENQITEKLEKIRVKELELRSSVFHDEIIPILSDITFDLSELNKNYFALYYTFEDQEKANLIKNYQEKFENQPIGVYLEVENFKVELFYIEEENIRIKIGINSYQDIPEILDKLNISFDIDGAIKKYGEESSNAKNKLLALKYLKEKLN